MIKQCSASFPSTLGGGMKLQNVSVNRIKHPATVNMNYG